MYRAFGLIIDSQLELPELLASNGAADVCIRFGRVPTSFAAVADRGICFQTGPARTLISLDDVGRFDIREGSEIVIDPAAGVSDSTLRLFVLGYSMGALLHQQGKLVLHASVVTRGDSCIALAGTSSQGKSTLAAALTRHGFDFLTDEVCVVDRGSSGAPVVVPGYPAQILWRRSVEKLDLRIDSLVRARPEIDKYVVPMGDRFQNESQVLTHLYALSSWNRDVVEIAPIEGFSRFKAFLGNTYVEQYLKGMGLQRRRQQLVAAIAPRVHVQRLSWPKSWSAMEDAIARIRDDEQRDNDWNDSCLAHVQRAA